MKSVFENQKENDSNLFVSNCKWLDHCGFYHKVVQCNCKHGCRILNVALENNAFNVAYQAC